MVPYFLTKCYSRSLYDNTSYLSSIHYDRMSLVMCMQNNLRKLRKERKLTQLSLQMKTGIEQALISKYETGERIPPTETLVILADFYNVSIDYILGRTDNPEINR